MTMKKEKAECDLSDELRCKRTDSRRWRCSKRRTHDSNFCEHHRDKRIIYKKNISIFTMKKEKAEWDLSDELRCKRTDSRRWRCSKRRTDDSNYCEHHRDKRKNYKKKKTRENGSPLEIVIGITKQCLSNKYLKEEPAIAETAILPHDLLTFENLKDVLTMEAWREHLTPTERSDLHSLLPEGQTNDIVVESLLSGQNLNFGNPALKWGTSVCRGEQFPAALLQRERELMDSQSQYFEDVRTYYDASIGIFEELKDICESCDQNEEIFRKELIRWKKMRCRTEGRDSN